MGRRVGSKEHNCQSEHDASVDRPHCHPRTSHYENRAGVSLNLVPTRVRVHETFIFLPRESLFILFSNDKPSSTAPQYQAAWHLLHPPTRYAAGEARFLPCAHHYPGPCFSARTRVRRGAAKRRLACSGIRCSINVAPGSQQLHRSVAASKVA